MEPEAFDQQDKPPVEQQMDYEARFKGLQREYNKLQQTLSAQQTALQKATEDLNSIKSGSQDALSQAQSQLAQLETSLKTEKQARELLQTQHQTVQQQLNALQGREKLRGKLVELKATELLPFVDAGDLAFDSLEDDAVKARVEGFRERLKLAGVTPKQDSQGAAVPIQFGVQDTQPDLDKMWAWLMDPQNQDHPDYGKNSTIYYSSLK